MASSHTVFQSKMYKAFLISRATSYNRKKKCITFQGILNYGCWFTAYFNDKESSTDVMRAVYCAMKSMGMWPS